MSSTKNYSIRRNPKDLIFNVIGLIILIDALYLVVVLAFIGIRNSLGLDATLVGFNALLFIVKTGFTVFWAGKLLSSWLRVDYYVLDGRLVLEGHSGEVQSNIYALSEIDGVRVEQTTGIARRNNFGTIRVRITGKEKPVLLRDVDSPKRIADLLYKQA